MTKKKNKKRGNIIFFVNASKNFIQNWEYYNQDIRLVNFVYSNVIVCTTYVEVFRNFFKANVIYCWWWHRSVPVIILARLFGIKTLVTGAIHAFDLSNAPSFYKKSLVYRIANLVAIRLATVNLCISKHQLQSIKMITNSEKLVLLYPSVHKRYNDIDYKPQVYNQLISICWLSNEQCVRKGIYKAINAVGCIKKTQPELLKDIQFIIAGKSGDGVKKLEKLIVEYGLEKVVSLRLDISEDEKYALLSSSDLLIAPSAMEGFGNATLEALSVGLPALVTSEGASKEVVGDTGFVSIGIEVDQISEQMVRFLKLGNEEKCKLKIEALVRANRDFCFEKRVETFNKIIKKYIDNE